MGSHRTVGRGGDHLPQRLGTHIPGGEYAGEIGAGGFIRRNVPSVVQRQLLPEKRRGGGTPHADEHAVAGKLPLRACLRVPQAQSRQLRTVEQRGNGAVPAEFYIGRVQQRLVIDLGGPQAVRRWMR